MPPSQLDVYRNPDRATAEAHPYLMVLQSDALSQLNTRAVAPLVPPKKLPLFERLMPLVQVEGHSYVLDVTNLGVVPVRELTNLVTNLSSEYDQFVRAIDLPFLGI